MEALESIKTDVLPLEPQPDYTSQTPLKLSMVICPSSSHWSMSGSDVPLSGMRAILRLQGKAQPYHHMEETVHQPEILATVYPCEE